MKILLSNDDGIRAPGIQAMHRALTDPHGNMGGAIGEVLVVAPLTVQSATSHGVTFHTPLMTTDVVVSPVMSGVAVDGRPADCVKLALTNIWTEQYGAGARPDLVVSGINAGANCGINVIYSGTVAAALEAAFLGVPSVAFSLHMGGGKGDFTKASAQARRVMQLLIDQDAGTGRVLAPHACLNVNLPLSAESLAEPEIVVCPMNTHGIVDAYEKRTSPSGEPYYWSVSDGLEFRGADAGTDVEELFRRHITITPLMYDLTRREALQPLAQALLGGRKTTPSNQTPPR